MVECPLPHTYEVTASDTIPVNIATVSVPYPAVVSAGDLLVLSIVRGDPIGVADVSPAVAGWTLLVHMWGANNHLHNVYLRVADGAETGTVSVPHPDVRTSSGVMTCLRGNTATTLDGAPVFGQTTAGSITAPSLTPTQIPRLLLYMSGVPNGARTENANTEGMCLLGGVDGAAYIHSNQVYAEVIRTPGPTGTRMWSGSKLGATAPWRSYAGGLIPWGLGGPTTGFIGSGTF